MKKPTEITSDIFQIGGSGESAPQDASIYLIKDGNKSAIIDAGSGVGSKAVIENIKLCGLEPSDIAYMFITHCHFDHTGGINSLREATGAKVVMHKEDAVFVSSGDKQVTGAEWYGGHIDPTPVDIIVNEKKKDFALNKLNVTIYHIPGHSPGSAVFTVSSDGQLVLFGQDVHGPINEIILRSNRPEYEKSLEFLISLNADILCEGHFGIYFGKEKVREFIKSFL
ncbi:MAG: MBL fold metallo-hydrolase [Leptospirales bacterium]|nr:MBL fold metallo-hydrolase [Leptospirales bacterium]